MGDLCYHCDGTGERDWLSGARCYECDGTGWKDDPLDDEDRWPFDEEDECDEMESRSGPESGAQAGTGP